MSKNKRKQAKRQKEKALPYYWRTRALQLLGFNSYREYLKSDLWARIRSEKLAEDPWCWSCGAKATQVHHKSYRKPVLEGLWMDQLMSVCRTCHRNAERTKNDRSKGLKVANHSLKRMRKKRERNDLRNALRPAPGEAIGTREDRELARDLVRRVIGSN